MKTLWLHKHNRDRLLVFCNGWGMDGAPFAPLQARDIDVLMCYNYTSLTADCDLSALIGGYAEATLLAWSMGVWAGQRLFSSRPEVFQRRIAINGTLCPIHESLGIPLEIFSSTLEQFDEPARLKFYHRVCRDRRILERFLAHQPERQIDDQRRELASLLHNTDCLSADRAIYTDIIVADRDLIVPTVNQKRFWQHKNFHLINGYHFPFYRWPAWDDLLHAQSIEGDRL